MSSIYTQITDKMHAAGMSQSFTDVFLKYTGLVAAGEKGLVNWDEVRDLNPDDTISLKRIHADCKAHCNDLDKLVIIKLNGGLGTSMGLATPKSIMEVKKGFSFLEIIVKQIEFFRKKYSIEIPLLLMDSFSTAEPSAQELQRIGFTQKEPVSFLQHKVPRLNANDLSPFKADIEKKEWCPPGHGDIFYSIDESGMLDNLIRKGYEYAFISNVDNLGATVDSYILEYIKDERIDFAIEITRKTQADRKGGTLFRKVTAEKETIELLEVAQVPKDRMKDFLDMEKFKYFNTNNIWINLKTLKKKLLSGSLDLSLIVNPKNIDGHDVIQLETAMGSAIGSFDHAIGIVVPRTRFAPVKRCEDFLVRRSDAYVLQEDYSLVMAPERMEKDLGEVVIDLDERYYKNFNDFERLFPEYPSLIDCVSLRVTGEVEFDVEVRFSGSVVIENNTGVKQALSKLGKKSFSDGTVTF